MNIKQIKEDLQDAIYRGDFNRVKSIVEENNFNIDLILENKKTISTYAASLGHISIVRYAKEKGASLRLKDECGETTYTAALAKMQAEVLKYLFERFSSRKEFFLYIMDGCSREEEKQLIMLSLRYIYREKNGNSCVAKFGPNYKVVKEAQLSEFSANVLLIQTIEVFFGVELKDYAIGRNTTVKQITQKIYRQLKPNFLQRLWKKYQEVHKK